MADETKQLRELLSALAKPKNEICFSDDPLAYSGAFQWLEFEPRLHVFNLSCPWCKYDSPTYTYSDEQGYQEANRWLGNTEHHALNCPWRAAREYLETYKDGV